MCFSDWDVVDCVLSSAITKARKQYACMACRAVIDDGELYKQVKFVDSGKIYVTRTCGACELDVYRIHIIELSEGCYDYESWCPPEHVWEYRKDYGIDESSREFGQRFLKWRRERLVDSAAGVSREHQ